jgi:hypothetical protein
MAMAAAAGDGRVVSQAEKRKIIFGSSLGTAFFPPGNATAALISASAAD